MGPGRMALIQWPPGFCWPARGLACSRHRSSTRRCERPTCNRTSSTASVWPPQVAVGPLTLWAVGHALRGRCLAYMAERALVGSNVGALGCPADAALVLVHHD